MLRGSNIAPSAAPVGARLGSIFHNAPNNAPTGSMLPRFSERHRMDHTALSVPHHAPLISVSVVPASRARTGRTISRKKPSLLALRGFAAYLERVSRRSFASASARSRRAWSSDACLFCAAIALPASVFGPVECFQGRQDRIRSACRARRSGVQPCAMPSPKVRYPARCGVILFLFVHDGQLARAVKPFCRSRCVAKLRGNFSH